MVQVASARLSGRHQAPLAALIGVLYWTAHTMIRPLIGPEVVDLGGTAGEAGIALASFAVIPTALAIPIGATTDRVGVKRMLIIGAVLMVLGGVVLLAPFGISGVIGSQVIAGIGTLMMWVGLQASITRTATGESPDRRNSRIASFSLALAAGQSIGPLLGGALADFGDRTLAFGAFTGLSAVLIVLASLTTPADSDATQRSGGGISTAVRSYPAAWRLLRRPVVFVTVAVSFMALVALDLRNAFLPLLLAPTGATPLQIGLLLTAGALAGFAARPLFALVMRRMRPAAVVGMVLTTSALTAMGIGAWSESLIIVVVLIVLNGFALGFAQPLTLSLMADFTAPGERGLASGLRSMANRAAQFANPAVLGAAGATVGLSGGFLAVGAMLLASTAACVILLLRAGPDRFESEPGGE